MERSNRKLEDSYRLTLESEKRGQEILEELHREREVLQKSQNRLKHASNMLDSSQNVVTQMYRHVVQDRLVLYCIAGVFCLVILLVIIFKS